jgi:hypothetical protein
MSATTGKSWQVGTYVDSTPSDLGGIPFDVKVQRHATTTKEAGTSQRRLASIQTGGVYYTIDFKMKMRVLGTFINVNAMPTEEADLPSFNLYVSDGTTKKGYTTSYVNTCNLKAQQDGAIVASIQVVSLAAEAKDLTITLPTSATMTKASVTTFSFGGTIAKWIEFDFGVNNNVTVVSTGNGVAMTEIYAKQAEYSGSAKWVKTVDPIYGFSTTVTSTLAITLVDNQDSPATVVYTFASVRASVNEYYVQELDLTYEGATWDGDSLVIS